MRTTKGFTQWSQKNLCNRPTFSNTWNLKSPQIKQSALGLKEKSNSAILPNMQTIVATSVKTELRDLVSDLKELTKFRIGFLVVLTTIFGFLLAGGVLLSFDCLILLIGTFLSCSGASTLNQYLERHYDALMPRTQKRPLVKKTINDETALTLGILMSVGGCGLLLLLSNLISGVLAVLTVLLYIAVYTPLKRYSWLNTFVGAIPGALPPVGGWFAASSSSNLGALFLFTLLFLWQLPHFYSIAWLYKDQYAKAGYKMLPCIDSSCGLRTRRQCLLFGLLLVQISVMPSLFNLTGALYFFGAFSLSAFMLYRCIQFFIEANNLNARKMLYSSLIYYPGLFIILAFDALLKI